MEKKVAVLITSLVVAGFLIFSVMELTGNLTGGIPEGCSDSDGGKVYTERGIVTYENRDVVYTDYCTSDIKLKEYYCFGDDIESERHLCREGCVDGACITE